METVELLSATSYIAMIEMLSTPAGAITLITGMTQHYKQLLYNVMTWKDFAVVGFVVMLCEIMVVISAGFSAGAMIVALAMALNITGNISLTKEYRTNVMAKRITNTK